MRQDALRFLFFLYLTPVFEFRAYFPITTSSKSMLANEQCVQTYRPAKFEPILLHVTCFKKNSGAK